MTRLGIELKLPAYQFEFNKSNQSLILARQKYQKTRMRLFFFNNVFLAFASARILSRKMCMKFHCLV